MPGTDLDDLDCLLATLEAINADDDAAALLDGPLEVVGALLDGLLGEPGLDRGDRPTATVDLLDQRGRTRVELAGEGLDQVAAAHRIGDARAVGLVRDDL